MKKYEFKLKFMMVPSGGDDRVPLGLSILGDEGWQAVAMYKSDLGGPVILLQREIVEAADDK